MKRHSILAATVGALALAACGGGEKAANNSAANVTITDPLGGNLVVEDLGNGASLGKVGGESNLSGGNTLGGNTLGGNSLGTVGTGNSASTNTSGNRL